MAKGMGFNAASASVQKKEGVSKKAADAIIASGARKASDKAKKKNPNLKKVKGKPKTSREKLRDTLRGNDHDYDDM